ncbi:rho GTPase-activating protein gacM-like isoform X2 [Pseudomyrmex gracilis]|uniref:rho GTPase-activating protein gacM-like isoform X2 n=1 Tax=Pseudomyrmex gracilis TaxID=219809 RepID=UPI000994A92C|nr:rho GTPase-activating protein gacM-like isoform X2 [Pseudomyrmex gracilis]
MHVCICVSVDGINEKAPLKKWGLLSFAKKSKSSINTDKTEGITLSEDGIKQVMQLVEYLSKEQNIVQEGIFRRTGKLTRQQDLKTAMSQGLSLDFGDGRFSVHDCASVLKGYLAELSEPLLTDSHYPAHCQIAELCSLDTKASDARLLSSLQLLLLLLPLPNRVLLKAILTLLNKTASYEHSNKMNSNTLATLFTPHLLCPRKLSPEALHINSQNLSCLVAFMIRKGVELFEIPPKLATDIRAYWIEQERKLLSPKKADLNESVPDTTSTAHTVFSFVDRKLTAKANSTQDTQAALAQLYAHIQAMPESAKKRRLVKQFNKENGQGTPRHIKHCKTKSLGDSIKKHIFQKKILGCKKFGDNTECNITRSSSEENILSMKLEDSMLPSRMLLSKSNDELSTENCNTTDNDFLHSKHINSNSNNLTNEVLMSFDVQDKVDDRSINVGEKSDDKNTHHNTEDSSNSMQIYLNRSVQNSNVMISDDRRSDIDKLTRTINEPHDIYSTCNVINCGNLSVTDDIFVRQNSESVFASTAMPNVQITSSKTRASSIKSPEIVTNDEPYPGSSCAHSLQSPIIRNRFKNVYSVHTSTPSSLLRQSLATNDYISTPNTNNDKSMSPITQSATKMTKAMQETMMTPRSRKPVMMVSTSNLCNLVTDSSCNAHILNLDMVGAINNCTSILEESQTYNSTADNVSSHIKETEINTLDTLTKHKEACIHIGNCCSCTQQVQQSLMSLTSTFKEYLLSRSVLTASPVDLSFTSRTGDFEQSESDLNIFNDDTVSDSLLHCLNGNQPESDTSGIASVSTNSTNSTEKIEIFSPRKRGTSLQRNDSKRSAKDSLVKSSRDKELKHGRNESTLRHINMQDSFQETSF